MRYPLLCWFSKFDVLVRIGLELVGGSEIGISRIVVMPLAAVALVPKKSSRSGRAGSRRWTCVSMMLARMCYGQNR